MGRLIAGILAEDDGGDSHAWVVRGDAFPGARQGALLAAWPLRYQIDARRFERPLIYLLQAGSRATLGAAFGETAGRGVFLNTVEAVRSGWHRGITPEFTLWLADYAACTPYDPATADEVCAIVQSALHSLYVEGEEAYYYVNLHDETLAVGNADPGRIADAWTGMYLFKPMENDAPSQVRLLGAGMALGRVIKAARMLREEWGIESEIWSCPSYTRLAREAGQASRWNILNPMAPPRRFRLAQCLDTSCIPVIAVTDYPRHVAAQIGVHLHAPFVAVGADAPYCGPRPAAESIVVHALNALVSAGRVASSELHSAMYKYGLAIGSGTLAN